MFEFAKLNCPHTVTFTQIAGDIAFVGQYDANIVSSWSATPVAKGSDPDLTVITTEFIYQVTDLAYDTRNEPVYPTF